MGKQKIAWIVICVLIIIALILSWVTFASERSEKEFPQIYYSSFESWGELGIFSQGQIVTKSASIFGGTKVGFLQIGSKSQLRTVQIWSENGKLRFDHEKVKFSLPLGIERVREITLENVELEIWSGQLLYLEGKTELDRTKIIVKKGRISLDGSNGFFAINNTQPSEATVGYFSLWIDDGVILPENQALIIRKSPYKILQGELRIVDGVIDLTGLVLEIQGSTVSYLPNEIKIESPDGHIFKTGSQVRVYIPLDYQPEAWLKEKGTDPVYTSKAFAFDQIGMILIPTLLMMALFIWIFWGGGIQGVTGLFEEIKAQKFLGSKFTLSDFGGYPNIKKEFEELLFYAHHPEEYRSLGIRPPNGILLFGPPGCGKTHLARCLAGEADAVMLNHSGPAFSKTFMGEGPKAVRQIFDNARKISRGEKSKSQKIYGAILGVFGKKAPESKTKLVFIFVDEIDAVLRVRHAGAVWGEREAERVTEEFFVEMDGLEKAKERIVILGATNRADMLDPAALRAGRFDWQFEIPIPDSFETRKEIFEIQVKGKKISSEVNVDLIVRQIYGFTGADIEKLVNEAGRFAIRRTFKDFARGHLGLVEIKMVDFQGATDKVLLGTERRLILRKEERKIAAYHEAGHATLAILSPEVDPVRHLSIVPRAQYLGITLTSPAKEQHLRSKKKLDAMLGLYVAGRLAEEAAAEGNMEAITDGAVNDIRIATFLAERMVCEYGMSDKLGFLNFAREENYFIPGLVSEETLKGIDHEKKRLVDEAAERVRALFTKEKAVLDVIAQALLKENEMDSVRIEEVLRKIKPTEKLNLFHLTLAEVERENAEK